MHASHRRAEMGVTNSECRMALFWFMVFTRALFELTRSSKSLSSLSSLHSVASCIAI